jgi:hypothetical protein
VFLMKLVSHVNGDSDLLDAWFEHYTALGVQSFHIIAHGPRSENARLFELVGSYPIRIEHEYGGEFHSSEKLRQMDAVLSRMAGEWIVLVDSDEFLELPYANLFETVRAMERLRVDVLQTPFVQRLTVDGSLSAPSVIEDPFAVFPLCSITLFEEMGVPASMTKHPLFFATGATRLHDAGNHGSPHGSRCRMAPMLGVTHHFKWRRTVAQRLHDRANSAHPWRHESAAFASYLAQHSNRVPTDGAFRYSREELHRRGLLGVRSKKKFAARWLLGALPERMDDGAVLAFRALSTKAHELRARASKT